MAKSVNISKEELTQELNSLYLKGEYQKVSDLLKEHAALFPPSVWNYNQGVAQYKLGNLPLARWYWENARWGDLQFKGVENNLQLAKEQLGLINIEASSHSNLSEYFDTVGKKSDLMLLASSLVLLGLVFWVGVKVTRPILRYGSFALFFLGGFWLSSVLFERSSVTGGREAIVIKETTLHEGPSQVFSSTGKIPAGLKVTLGIKQETWALIESPQEFYGWVGLSDLKMITSLKN